MIKRQIFQPHLAGHTPQWWMTWALFVMIVTTITTRLLQQSPDIVLGVVAVAFMLTTTGAIVWQQWQLRHIQRRIGHLERHVHQPKKQPRAKPITPTPVTHVDIDQFFHQGQTKH